MEIQYTKAHIADLERSIGEFNEKRKELTTQKVSLESNLSELKSHRNPKRIDRNLENSIEEVKKRLGELNNLILDINEKKRKKSILKQDIEKGLKTGKVLPSMPAEAYQIHRNEDSCNKLRLDILTLKDKYLDFAGDHTRVSSMRQMSADFVKELEGILKNKR